MVAAVRMPVAAKAEAADEAAPAGTAARPAGTAARRAAAAPAARRGARAAPPPARVAGTGVAGTGVAGAGGIAGAGSGGTGGTVAACGTNNDPDTGTTCNTVVPGGSCVLETMATGSPPAATGGQIMAGTYDLTSRTA